MYRSTYETLDTLTKEAVASPDVVVPTDIRMRTATSELLDTLSKLTPENIFHVRLEKPEWRPLLGPWFECEIVTRDGERYLTQLSRHMLRELTNLHSFIYVDFDLEEYIAPHNPTIVTHELHSYPEPETHHKLYEKPRARYPFEDPSVKPGVPKKRTVTVELLEMLSKLTPDNIIIFRLERAKWKSLSGPWFECELTTREGQTYLMDFSRHMLRELTNLHPCIPKEFPLEKYTTPRKPTILTHELHSRPEAEMKKAHENKLPITPV